MRVFSSLMLILLAGSMQAQSLSQPNLPDSLRSNKVKFSFIAGTSFFYSPKTFSGTSLYVAPKLSYLVTPKLRLNVGIMLVQQRFNLSYPLYTNSLTEQKSVVIKNTSSLQGIAFAEADYLLSDKLTISGSIYKSINPNDKTQDMAWKNSFQMMSMGVNYKINNYLSVGAGVRMVQTSGYNPFFSVPYMSPEIGYQPFYNNF